MLRKIFIGILLGLLSISFGILIIEICLRSYQFLGEKSFAGLKPYRTTLEWMEDPEIGKVFFVANQKGWFVTPSKEYFNFIRTNSAGFNDAEHEYKKPKNTFRILFLGDSFVADVQTKQNRTFIRQIEESLNKKIGIRKIEVIALGMGDTGTAQQYLTLKKIGLKYNPDVVMHMFLTANDLKNNSPSLMKDSYRPYFTVNEKGVLKLIPHQKYSARSYAKLKDFAKKLYFMEILLNGRQKIQERDRNKVSDYPLDYHVYDRIYDKEYKKSWEITKLLIKESKRITEEVGGKYILVTLANNEQVNSEVWKGLMKTYPNMQKANLDLEKPDRLIESFCKKEKITCKGLLADFQKFVKKNPNKPTHYKIDGHWNQQGENIAASSLIRFLYNEVKN